MAQEWSRGAYRISLDPERLDLEVIWGYLVRSYWAEGRSREQVAASLANSMPFGLYHSGTEGVRQIGLARVVTDRATFAYLCDVFVLEAHRGQGLGVWLVETLLGVPELRSLKWVLGTRDAHELYRRFGFYEPPPGRMMRRDPR